LLPLALALKVATLLAAAGVGVGGGGSVRVPPAEATVQVMDALALLTPSLAASVTL
jgi:hypothetical protein